MCCYRLAELEISVNATHDKIASIFSTNETVLLVLKRNHPRELQTHSHSHKHWPLLKSNEVWPWRQQMRLQLWHQITDRPMLLHTQKKKRTPSSLLPVACTPACRVFVVSKRRRVSSTPSFRYTINHCNSAALSNRQHVVWSRRRPSSSWLLRGNICWRRFKTQC